LSTGWTYVLTPRAKRAMEHFPIDVQRRIYEALDRLASDVQTCDVRKLVGHEREYRLRVGDYRVFFGVEAKDRVYVILEIADRKDAYR
jgi:mRNA interferase RelE/StbE